MPNRNNEDISYAFTGDVTSLRQAVNEAIALLDSYGNKIKEFVSGGGFQNSINSVTNTVNHVRRELSGVFEPLRTQLNSLRNPFARLSQSMQRMRSVFNSSFDRLPESLRSVASAFRRVSSDSDDAGSSFIRLAAQALGVRNIMVMLTSIPLGKWLADGVNQSIAYTENLNLFTVAMGNAYDRGIAFVQQMSELYGMDPSNLIRYAGNFYQLADAIDMNSIAAANISLGLTKMSNDIASLFSVPIETVFENLSSGMQGTSRAVRKYGMDIRTTTLQQTALSLGITEQVETMSEANRQGLRYITMMRQAENASGDFARTIETPANQLRIFKEQMAQLGRAIGDLFITPLTIAISYVNGFVMALRMIIQFIGSVLGLVNSVTSTITGSDTADTVDDIAASVGGVGGAAKKAATELKKMLAPFDELTLLQQPETDAGGGGGGGAGLGALGTMDPAILHAIESMQVQLENVRMRANEVRDAILSFLGFEVDGSQIIKWNPETLKQNLMSVFPEMTGYIEGVFTLWSTIFESLGIVWQSVVELIADVWSNLLQPVFERVGETLGSTIAEHVIPILTKLIEVITSLWTDILAPLLNWLGQVLGPSIKNIVDDVLDIVDWVVSNISGLIMGLLQVIQGIIDFVAGVFAGDWARAWNGIVGIFAGLFNSISSIVVSVLNFVISIINSAISVIYNIVITITNMIMSVASHILDALGLAIDLTVDVATPKIPYIPTPQVAMASGGVVTSPTNALIGEGRYDEMVMPLGNSPQMREFANSVANRVNSGEQISLLKEQNELLRQILDKTGLSLDGRDVTDMLARHQRDRSRALGV